MKNVISRAVAFGIFGLAAHSAMAGEIPNSQSAMNSSSLPLSLMKDSGGNDWMRYEIAPNWSQELGWSLKGTLGSYITNDLALAAIVEYGPDKREYLANAGFRLSDQISFVASVGMLEEHQEFVADAGKEIAQQMEYGASLKGAYEFGLFSGFELNAYLADANAKSDNIETGKLYGIQLLTKAQLADTTHIDIAGGYEWLHWDAGEENNGYSLRANGVQQLTNNLRATANVKLGASEYVYGGGLAYQLGDQASTNTIGLDYEYIEGQHGIQNDQRIQLSWRMGLGATSPSAGEPSKRGNASGQGTAAISSASADHLLSDVMRRPEFLPKRVLARTSQSALACTIIPNVTFDFIDNDVSYYDMINISRASFTTEQLALIDGITSEDIVVYSGLDLTNLALYSPSYSPQLVFQSNDGGTLYFQFSNDMEGTQKQNVFGSGDYVKIQLNLGNGCIEFTDQYFGG